MQLFGNSPRKDLLGLHRSTSNCTVLTGVKGWPLRVQTTLCTVAGMEMNSTLPSPLCAKYNPRTLHTKSHRLRIITVKAVIQKAFSMEIVHLLSSPEPKSSSLNFFVFLHMIRNPYSSAHWGRGLWLHLCHVCYSSGWKSIQPILPTKNCLAFHLILSRSSLGLNPV